MLLFGSFGSRTAPGNARFIVMIDILNRLNLNGFNRPGGTDKASDHSYAELYDIILAPYRERPINLLEIGIYQGGSLLMWQHYFPDAVVSAIDIDPRGMHPTNTERLDYDRLRLYYGSAYTMQMVEVLMQSDEYDIIIDDGPHTLQSQVFAARNYRQLLAPGGVLVIEDVQDITHLDALTAVLPERERGWVQTYDLRHVKGRYDDIVWVYRMPG